MLSCSKMQFAMVHVAPTKIPLMAGMLAQAHRLLLANTANTQTNEEEKKLMTCSCLCHLARQQTARMKIQCSPPQNAFFFLVQIFTCVQKADSVCR